ncbi:hypothetical protein JR334_11480 [Clostridia bacterium]|nr:hypothetical protein JR334_11480 [Clostridia bacterium]
MQKIRLLVKSIAFIVLFLFILTLSNQYLAYHMPLLRTRIDRIYEEETVADVVLIGGSHALHSFNPESMENVLGVDTMMVVSPGQNLKITYMLLEEIYKERGAKLVVLETFSLIHPMHNVIDNPKDGRFWKYRDVLNEIPFSINKVNTAIQLVEPQYVLNLLVPVVNSHNNWKDWEQLKSNLQYVYDPDDFGFILKLTNTLQAEDADLYAHSDYEYLFDYSEENAYWLEKICELVKANDSELFTIMAPIYTPFLEHSNYTEQTERLEEDLQELGVFFLDMNRETELGRESLTFKGEKAFKDGVVSYNQHLSYIGNYQATQFLMSYIADRLGIAEYDWTNNQYDLESFLDGIEMDGKIVMASYCNVNMVPPLEKALESLADSDLGLEPAWFTNYGTGFVYKDFRQSEPVLKSFFTNQELILDFDEQEEANLPFSLSVRKLEGDCIETILDGAVFAANRDGLMILIYDPQKGQICKRAFFEISKSIYRQIW